METPSTFATDGDGEAGNRLQLPKHAWPRRHLVDARLPLEILSALLFLAGCFLIASRFVGSIAAPAPLKWVGSIAGLAWFGLALGAWRADPNLFRRSLSLVLLGNGAIQLVVATTREHSGFPWNSASMALLWIALAIGVWRASHWARMGVVVVGFTLYGLGVFSTAIGFQIAERAHANDEFFRSVAIRLMGLVAVAFIFAPLVGLAIYGLLPQTRRHFADARRTRLRDRPVTG